MLLFCQLIFRSIFIFVFLLLLFFHLRLFVWYFRIYGLRIITFSHKHPGRFKLPLAPTIRISWPKYFWNIAQNFFCLYKIWLHPQLIIFFHITYYIHYIEILRPALCKNFDTYQTCVMFSSASALSIRHGSVGGCYV